MTVKPPNIPKDAPAEYASSVGKMLQNCGTIEYLLNEILGLLLADPLLMGHFSKQRVAVRSEVLFDLLKRKEAVATGIGFSLATLQEQTKAVFSNRNKVAHNPLVIRASNSDPTEFEIGIHVLRHTQKGQKEEWVFAAQLQHHIAESQNILLHFNTLLSILQSPASPPASLPPASTPPHE
jgi:hypothetical protein